MNAPAKVKHRIEFQPDPKQSLSCPDKEDITQYPPSHSSLLPVQYDNPLSLSKPAYAVLQNLLSLTPYQKRSRLIDLCLTLSENLPFHEVSKRLNSFMTNVVRPCSVSFVRVTGRTRKGRIHYHIVLAMGNYYGRRRSGKRRLSRLRKRLKQRAVSHGFGITTVSLVKDIEGYSIYLARHIDRSRLREDRKLRRASYSANVKRVCMPKFSWASPFAWRWRQAVAETAKLYGYDSSASRKWVWTHYREILQCADSLFLPARDFKAIPRTVGWRDKLWTVLRLPENPSLFVLQRPAEHDERFNCWGATDRTKIIYSTITELVLRRDLQRIVNAERLSAACSSNNPLPAPSVR